jgi:hypothetical protein
MNPEPSDVPLQMQACMNQIICLFVSSQLNAVIAARGGTLSLILRAAG